MLTRYGVFFRSRPLRSSLNARSGKQFSYFPTPQNLEHGYPLLKNRGDGIRMLTGSFLEALQKNCSIVDRTSIVKEVVNEPAQIEVRLGPKGSGKSHLLSVLHCFFSERVNGVSTAELFHGSKINSLDDGILMPLQGQHPVVFIDLEDIGHKKFEETYKKLYGIVLSVYEQHDYLLQSDKLSKKQKNLYKAILNGKANQEQLEKSIRNLLGYLHLHCGKKPYLLIDNCDAFVISGYKNTDYEAIIDLLQKLMCTTLKSNYDLEKAVITGVFYVAELFNGIDNMEVFFPWSKKHNQYLVFSELDVAGILENSSYSPFERAAIKSWFGGDMVHHAGKVYSPQAIVTCVQRGGEMGAYWKSGNHQFLRDVIQRAPLNVKKEFALLLQGKVIEKFLCEDKLFQRLNQNYSSVWTLLLMSGYLTVTACKQTDQGMLVKLAIPNKEMRNVYRNVIEQWLSNDQGFEWYNEFISELVSGNILACKKYLDQIILEVAKFHDEKKQPEAFYEGLLLSLTASLQSNGQYEVDSHRDNNHRFCIRLISKCDKPHIVFELKCAQEREALVSVSQNALQHIDESLLSKIDSHDTIKIGVGYRGKYLELSYKAKEMEYKPSMGLV